MAFGFIAGTVLITEWINVEYFGNTRFDSPVLRFGKAFATLGVALGIVAVFQVCAHHLKNPRILTDVFEAVCSTQPR